VGVKFFHAEGQTDMTKLIVAFFYFANASKKKAAAPVKGMFFVICKI